MKYSAIGTWPDGRTAYAVEETATAIVARVDEMHKGGVMPVHINRDGKPIETTEELDRLIAEEGASNAHRS